MNECLLFRGAARNRRIHINLSTTKPASSQNVYPAPLDKADLCVKKNCIATKNKQNSRWLIIPQWRQGHNKPLSKRRQAKNRRWRQWRIKRRAWGAELKILKIRKILKSNQHIMQKWYICAKRYDPALRYVDICFWVWSQRYSCEHSSAMCVQFKLFMLIVANLGGMTFKVDKVACSRHCHF